MTGFCWRSLRSRHAATFRHAACDDRPDLREEHGLTYIFIAHDLGGVRHVSDQITVMDLGGIVELAPADPLYATPAHPYPQALLSAVPEIDDGHAPRRERIALTGDAPSPIHKPTGCSFHPRCPYAQDKCRTEQPTPVTIAPGRQVTCHFPLIQTPAGPGGPNP